jgi:hypothetical protein
MKGLVVSHEVQNIFDTGQKKKKKKKKKTKKEENDVHKPAYEKP